jgi:hypothetical protein
MIGSFIVIILVFLVHGSGNDQRAYARRKMTYNIVLAAPFRTIARVFVNGCGRRRADNYR